MASFTVHVPEEGIDPLLRSERIAFVRDGFSWGAFLFGPLYLLRHRCYVAAAGWIVAVIAIFWACHLLHMPRASEILLALLIMLFTGLEASTLRRLALHRRGLELRAVVSARSIEEGEAAFFRSATARQPAPQNFSAPPRPGRPAPSGVIGLFPEPGA
jgi:hypothetical protein